MDNQSSLHVQLVDYRQQEFPLILSLTYRQVNAIKGLKQKWSSAQANLIQVAIAFQASAFRIPMDPVRGETLGLVGFGRIGRAVAPKAKAFDLKILVHDPYVPDSVAEEYGVELASLDRVMSISDYVSLHTPLTKETRYYMINVDRLRQMKKTAYLINTARGPVVEQVALVQTLQEGWIAGAAIDVFEKEPTTGDNPLFQFENLIATNHVAFYFGYLRSGAPPKGGTGNSSCSLRAIPDSYGKSRDSGQTEPQGRLDSTNVRRVQTLNSAIRQRMRMQG